MTMKRTLTAREIAALSDGSPRPVSFPGPHFCHYCGGSTRQAAYLHAGRVWPSCCAKDGCIEQWAPLPTPAAA